jgi:hypothetical protein
MESGIDAGGTVFEPGTLAPPGIYVVTHRKPAHALPHELVIVKTIALPRCSACEGVHFSRKCNLPLPIEQSEFFGHSNGVTEFEAMQLRCSNGLNPGLPLTTLTVSMTEAAEAVHNNSAIWGESCRAAEDFFEVWLSYITTLIDVYKGRYRIGDHRGGDRNRTHAERSINYMRRLISRNRLVGGDFRERLKRRCDELHSTLRLAAGG